MRRGNDNGWHEVDGKTILISLGADYCAEHECGIGGIKRLLGIDGVKDRFARERAKYTKPHGIERRRISNHDSIKLYEHGDKAVILCEDAWWLKRFDDDAKKVGMAKMFKEGLPMELRLWPEMTLATAWDDGSFGILGKGEDAKKIRELYKEIEAKNVAIWNGGRINPFQNSGLIIAIIDRIRPEDLETLRAGDEDVEKLQAASDATGIIKRLEEAKKGFYACSPKWFNPEFKPSNEEKKSAHPVIYWLNPMEQNDNNFGWYTVEDLDQWIQDQGPIPKGKKAKV
jgi:hypothetical protein